MASSGKPSLTEPRVARPLLTPEQAVRQSLRPYLPAKGEHSLTLLLGYSGGIDSSVLLHLLATLATELPLRLHAVHVHHGLSPNADDWAAFCTQQCRSLQIPLQVMRIDLAPHRALGVEGAARAARYAAFATAGRASGSRLLLLAQHRDDQAETLLTQLLRGAGVAGLAAMPLARRLGELELLRPLLHNSRADIQAWARRHRLHWIEDESNQDQDRRRNFLRHAVLPRLEQASPAASANIARSAGHLAQAAQLLSVMAREDLQRLAAPASGFDEPPLPASGAAPAQLDIPALLALGDARAANALREWCVWRGAPQLPADRMAELLRQMATPRRDASPLLQLPGWCFTRYRNLLFLLNNLTEVPEPPEAWSRPWQLPAPGSDAVAEHWPELGGRLVPQWVVGAGLSLARLSSLLTSLPEVGGVRSNADAGLHWRLRRGGERIRLGPTQSTKTLGNLWQAQGLPPWQRQRLPLLWCGDTLLAVPGLGCAADWQAQAGETGLKFAWRFSPPGDREAPVV